MRTLLDGRRFVCWADEFSRLLADPAFEQFAKDGLKVWRKLNGVFCAATQSPSDALASPISRTIIEQTPTKILFPNPMPRPRSTSRGSACREREFKLIKEQLEPGSRMFLVKQGHHSVVCQLDLKGFDAELAVISGRASAVERMYRSWTRWDRIRRNGCRVRFMQLTMEIKERDEMTMIKAHSGTRCCRCPAGLAPAAQAQWAVIDVGAIAQLMQQVQQMEQAAADRAEQLNQAQQEYQSMTGPRGMQNLLSGINRNYLPRLGRKLP